jgi:DNA uptake protein ComE-like DNA-binding protein
LIIEKKIGNFKQIEDLKNVPGIGDAKFEAIKENINVK